MITNVHSLMDFAIIFCKKGARHPMPYIMYATDVL